MRWVEDKRGKNRMESYSGRGEGEGEGEGEDTEAFVVKLQLQPVAGLTLGLMCRYLSWVFTDTLMVAQVIRSNRPML